MHILFHIKVFHFYFMVQELKMYEEGLTNKVLFVIRHDHRYDITWQSRHILVLKISTCLLFMPLCNKIIQVSEVKDRAQPQLRVTRFVFQEEVCFFLKYKHIRMHNIKLTTFVLKCLPERCPKQVELRGY
jgi:hypothetical protein